MPKFIKLKKSKKSNNSRSKSVLKLRKDDKSGTKEESDMNHPMVGTVVFFESEGVSIGGMVKQVKGTKAVVALGLPMDDGSLFITGRTKEVNVHTLEKSEVKTVEGTVKEWSSYHVLGKNNIKAVALKDTDGVITDYQNVTIRGYGSTFEHITRADRDGDYVNQGAFDEDIETFKRNPVMLIDHQISVRSMAGSFNTVRIEEDGLFLEGTISNAPEINTIRFLIKEGHLKTLSIGGFMFYGDNGREILRVMLFEVSLVAVPANPDAQFTTRSISEESITKAFKNFTGKNLNNNN